MLSVDAASRDRHRVRKAVQKPRNAPAKDVPSQRNRPSPARSDLRNSYIPGETEGFGVLPRPPEEAEQPDGFDFDEDSDAPRQERSEAEHVESIDSVRTYLNQIGRVRLLTADQEVALAQRIEVGLYAADRLRRADELAEKVPAQLRQDLRCIARDGERAKNHLVEANLRLVVSVAKRYTGRGLAFQV